MTAHIANVQISHAGPDDDDGTAYWTTGSGADLLAMYGELLGMEHEYPGYHKLVHPDGHRPAIGFEYAPDDAPPVWGDAERPAQVHVEIEVRDLAEASSLVTSHGASHLHDGDVHRVFADPAGHPFCIYVHDDGSHPTDSTTGPLGRITHVTFDCLSPRALAMFYERLLGFDVRTMDTPERVEISNHVEGVALAFQRVVGPPPRWPDPAHPAQLHLDLVFDDPSARELAERIGAVHLALPERPDNLVYADPAGHPFCLDVPM